MVQQLVLTSKQAFDCLCQDRTWVEKYQHQFAIFRDGQLVAVSPIHPVCPAARLLGNYKDLGVTETFFIPRFGKQWPPKSEDDGKVVKEKKSCRCLQVGDKKFVCSNCSPKGRKVEVMKIPRINGDEHTTFLRRALRFVAKIRHIKRP